MACEMAACPKRTKILNLDIKYYFIAFYHNSGCCRVVGGSQSHWADAVAASPTRLRKRARVRRSARAHAQDCGHSR